MLKFQITHSGTNLALKLLYKTTESLLFLQFHKKINHYSETPYLQCPNVLIFVALNYYY